MNLDYEYLTEKEVSGMTKLALSTLRNDRFKRTGIPYRKKNKSVRYLKAEVIAYMESRKIETNQTN
jgi:predicted DNA-binding transcriptional regulator AlpA